MPDWCACEMRVWGPEEEVAAFAKTLDSSKNETGEVALLKTFYPRPPEEADWYTWNCRHWGNKWGDRSTTMQETERHGLLFSFYSPWCPPIEGLVKISKDWLELNFEIEYYDELRTFSGTANLRSGQVVSNVCDTFGLQS